MRFLRAQFFPAVYAVLCKYMLQSLYPGIACVRNPGDTLVFIYKLLVQSKAELRGFSGDSRIRGPPATSGAYRPHWSPFSW